MLLFEFATSSIRNLVQSLKDGGFRFIFLIEEIFLDRTAQPLSRRLWKGLLQHRTVQRNSR